MESNEKILYEPKQNNDGKTILDEEESLELMKVINTILGDNMIVSEFINSLSELISDFSKQFSPLENLDFDKITTHISTMETYLELIKVSMSIPEQVIENNKNRIYSALYHMVVKIKDEFEKKQQEKPMPKTEPFDSDTKKQ